MIAMIKKDVLDALSGRKDELKSALNLLSSAVSWPEMISEHAAKESLDILNLIKDAFYYP